MKRHYLAFVLLALAWSQANAQYTYIYDSSTVRNYMHACPVNSVMAGVHAGANLFYCAYGKVSYRAIFPIIDYAGGPPNGTVRADMHACPFGFVMTGFHAKANRLECVFANIISEFVDDNTQHRTPWGLSMHACPPGTFMTGIHLVRNDLLCGW